MDMTVTVANCTTPSRYPSSGKARYLNIPLNEPNGSIAAKRIGLHLCFIELFIVFYTIAAHAQMNTGEITGILKDPTRAFINGATVTATHLSTRQTHVATTTRAGQYLLAKLPPGEYELTVDANGFQQIVEKALVLHGVLLISSSCGALDCEAAMYRTYDAKHSVSGPMAPVAPSTAVFI